MPWNSTGFQWKKNPLELQWKNQILLEKCWYFSENKLPLEFYSVFLLLFFFQREWVFFGGGGEVEGGGFTIREIVSISYITSLKSITYVCIFYPSMALQKHAYSNILKILPPKNENFQIKNPDIFHTSAQNIDCGYSLEPPRRGGSNEYSQSMF